MMTAEGGLMENPWSWTYVANLVALESPVGVGYSYCEAQAQGEKCKNTDKDTAKASRAALQHFFQKFPELANSDFFITGESYGGVYIPTLAKEILDHAPEIKLRGLAVGDPCTDNAAQADSMDTLWCVRGLLAGFSLPKGIVVGLAIPLCHSILSVFDATKSYTFDTLCNKLLFGNIRYGHKYGLVDDQIFDLLWNHCGARSPSLLTMGGVHWVAGHWNEHLKAKRKQLGDDAELLAYSRKLRETLIWDSVGDRVGMSDECTLAYRKFLMATSRGLSQSWHDMYIDDYSLFAPVTSKEDDDLFAYMSRPDVRAALHVEEAPTSQWPYADVGFDYSTLTGLVWCLRA
jgi:cathepsin A (carboxypeptidase C)